MMATLYEKYITGEDVDESCFGVFWFGQSFTPSVAHDITSVKLLASQLGTAGILTVSIRAVDADGLPTGADLAVGTYDGSTIPAYPTKTWIEVILGTTTLLRAFTKYAITIKHLGGDGSNHVSLWEDASSPSYSGGNLLVGDGSADTWENDTVADILFEEWGVLIPSPGIIWVEGDELHFGDENGVERVATNVQVLHADIAEVTVWLG